MTHLKTYRRQKGQAIIEGAAFLVAVIPLMVAFVLLTLFIGMFSYYHLATLQVADAGARSAVDDRYWLGVERPDYSAGKTTQRVQDAVTSLWHKVGLPGTVSTTVDLDDPNTVVVTVTANSVPLPSGGFLPPTLSLQSKAAQPYNIDRPTGIIGLSNTYGTKGSMGIYIPTWGSGAANGPYHQLGPIPKFPPHTAAPYQWHMDVAAPDTAITKCDPPIQYMPNLY